MRGSYLSWRSASPPELFGEPDGDAPWCGRHDQDGATCSGCYAEYLDEMARAPLGRADDGGTPDDLEDLPY